MKRPYDPKSIPVEKLDWESLIPLIGMAQAAVARFEGILLAMVNPELLLSPLTTQEAVLSSRIEGTQASLEDVLRYDAAPRKDVENKDDIREIQNYRAAMSNAVGWVKRSGITVETIRRIHRVLMTDVRGGDKTPGEFRTIQNYIGYYGDPIEKAIFIPPAPEALPDALSQFESYLGVTQKDTIVQTALAHAQFELLHPFIDGNGRVGRILIPLVLYSKGVISRPTFYISEYFDDNRTSYYDRLGALSSKGDWQGWTEFFLNAVSIQAEVNTQRAVRILRLYDSMKDDINRATRSQHSLQTLDALFACPFMTKTDFVKRTGIAVRTAERLLLELESAGILVVAEKGAGRRPSVYAFSRLLAITEKAGGLK